MLSLVDRQVNAEWMTLNDLEWLFHDKMRFWPAVLESERLNVRNNTTSAILRCSVHFTIYMYLYLYSYRTETAHQLRMYAQLTRCFSAVAELLVEFTGLLIESIWSNHTFTFTVMQLLRCYTCVIVCAYSIVGHKTLPLTGGVGVVLFHPSHTADGHCRWTLAGWVKWFYELCWSVDMNPTIDFHE